MIRESKYFQSKIIWKKPWHTWRRHLQLKTSESLASPWSDWWASSCLGLLFWGTMFHTSEHALPHTPLGKSMIWDWLWALKSIQMPKVTAALLNSLPLRSSFWALQGVGIVWHQPFTDSAFRQPSNVAVTKLLNLTLTYQIYLGIQCLEQRSIVCSLFRLTLTK